jgi:thiamine pyrophosphokinase
MEWDPSRFFRVAGSPSPYVLLNLNQPINESAFGVLSEHASYIICADGGANRLYDMMKKHGKEAKEVGTSTT